VIPSSVTNVEIPNFMSSLNHTEKVSKKNYSPSTGNSLATRQACSPLHPIGLWAFRFLRQRRLFLTPIRHQPKRPTENTYDILQEVICSFAGVFEHQRTTAE
jgi:hypothetical protein